MIRCRAHCRCAARELTHHPPPFLPSCAACALCKRRQSYGASCMLHPYPTETVPLMVTSHDCDNVVYCNSSVLRGNGTELHRGDRGIPQHTSHNRQHRQSQRRPGYNVAAWVADARLKMMGLDVRWDLLAASGNVTDHCAGSAFLSCPRLRNGSRGDDGTPSQHRQQNQQHHGPISGAVKGSPPAVGTRTRDSGKDAPACTAAVASRNHNTFPAYRERDMLAFLAAQTSDTACWD